MQQITLVGVTGATAVIIQLLVLYVPRVNAWFAGLASHVKALVFLAVDFLVTIFWMLLLYLQCFQLISCPTYDPSLALRVALELVGLFLTTVGIQQASYLVAPKPRAVREAAASRPS